MNLKRFKVAFAAILMVGTVFTACSGEDGAIGPEGATGNANVTSNTFTVIAADWGGVGRAPKYDANITQAVVNSGTVSAFITTDTITDATTWQPIPVGNFSFSYKTDSAIFLTPGFTGANFTTYYKVVSIPSGAKLAGVNVEDYEEIKAVYGLED